MYATNLGVVAGGTGMSVLIAGGILQKSGIRRCKIVEPRLLATPEATCMPGGGDHSNRCTESYELSASSAILCLIRISSQSMPTISHFFGIVIQMFWREHAPPHFHALYGE